jgi:hypothetical protein
MHGMKIAMQKKVHNENKQTRRRRVVKLSALGENEK